MQAHCKAPRANAQTKALSKSLQSQRREKLFLKNFPTLQKNIKRNAQPDTTMTRKLNTDNGLQTRWTRTPAPNSTYKKLAVQWLNEVRFFNQTFLQVDSFVLRNRQLLIAANRCSKF